MSNESIEILAQKRERAIIRTSMIGVGTNVMLAVFKAIIGVISNSIAITLDAINNISDALFFRYYHHRYKTWSKTT